MPIDMLAERSWSRQFSGNKRSRCADDRWSGSAPVVVADRIPPLIQNSNRETKGAREAHHQTLACISASNSSSSQHYSSIYLKKCPLRFLLRSGRLSSGMLSPHRGLMNSFSRLSLMTSNGGSCSPLVRFSQLSSAMHFMKMCA